MEDKDLNTSNVADTTVEAPIEVPMTEDAPETVSPEEVASPSVEEAPAETQVNETIA